ncbi:hypothetical protein ACFLYJ_01575 [Candidatus Cloacimonadota bacterium]
MKKIIIVLTILATSFILSANLDFFPENPANYALRNYTHISFPTMTEFNIANTLLVFDDINIFEEGHHLTENEKEKLTSGNLDIIGNFNTTFVEFGSKNWNFYFGVIGSFELGVLDKTYSEFVFYGNEANELYETEIGKGSKAFTYWKSSFAYALPYTVSLGMIPGLFPADTDNNFISVMRDLPIQVGANLNINYSMQYAGILESYQDFGTTPDSAYYDLHAKYGFSDEKTSGRMNPSLGFGLKAQYLDGSFHFSMDDIFLQLSYRNLAGGRYVKTVSDYLSYLQPDYQSEEWANIENDSLRIKEETIKFKPSVSIGAEYTFWKKLDVMMKYSSNELTLMDGFVIGAGYQLGILPLQAKLGFSELNYFNFQSGLRFSKFEWISGITFYNGLFRYAKGMGFNSTIDFKF